MDTKLYKIYIESGKNTIATFDAIIIPSDNESTIYCRFDDETNPNGGMIRVCHDGNSIGLLYDIFTVLLTVNKKEEVNGNLHFVCSNDLLSQVDVYIADMELWMSSGKAIFSEQ